MKIIEHPNEYKEGVRILMLTMRSKEGGKVNKPDRVARKLVSKNPQEFDECFANLQAIAKDGERIYATVDPRNVEKAIRIFKQRQLDADYYDTANRHGFYYDIYNQWISALQAPQARQGTLFMVDIDYGEDSETEIKVNLAYHRIPIRHQYETKNGKHLILEPFNPALVSFEILKNHMMLWAY